MNFKYQSIDDIRGERDLALCERAELIRMLEVCVAHFDQRERIEPRSYNRNMRRLIKETLNRIKQDVD